MASQQVTSSLLAGAFDLEIVSDSGNFYGFMVGSSTKNLIRIDFGSDLDNVPSIVNLGNPGGLFTNPDDITLYQEGSEWFGLVVNGTGNNLLRLDFGDSIASIPSIQDLGDFGFMSIPFTIQVVMSGSDLYAMAASANTSEVYAIDFGNSIENTPTATQVPFSGASSIRGFSVFRECDSWYGLIGSFGNDDVLKLEFGTDLESISSVSSEGVLSYDQPTGTHLFNEGGTFYGLIQSRNGDLYRLDYGDSLMSTPTGTNLGNFGILGTAHNALTVVNVESQWYAFTIDFSSNKLFQIQFPNNCSGTVETSDDITPNGLKFSSSGDFVITLAADNGQGEIDYFIDTVTVTMDTVPDISFVVDSNRCLDNPNSFTSFNLSGDISSYSWDFDGDSVEDSTDPHPTFQFDSAATYMVNVDVQNLAGCQNSFTREIAIYPPPPTPAFNIQQSTLCTNNNLNFNNLTNEAGYDDILTYTWDFNSEGTSSAKDTVFAFTSPGSKTVTLQSFLPGCSSPIVSDDYVLNEGPVVNFNFINNCFGDSISFDNISSGEGITGFLWDFGDGNGSTSEDPGHQYTVADTFSVSLEVTNDAECSNTSVNSIIVNDQSLLNFTFSTVIENLPTNFMGVDLTSNQDSIDVWEWTFPDSNSSNLQDPQYTFTQPGDNDVSLNIVTAQGCEDSLTQTVTAQESICPTIDFQLDSVFCIDEKVSLINNTVNATEFKWDFCSGDLMKTPSVHQISSNGDLIDNLHLNIYNENGIHIGFTTDVSQNTIRRLEYDSGLMKPPKIFDLGNPDDVLNGPEEVELYKENNTWYGIIVNSLDNKVFRLSFDSSITTPPSIEEIHDGSLLSLPFNVEIVNTSGGVNAIISSGSESEYYVFDFGNSITNMPTITEKPLTGPTSMRGFSLIRECNEFYGQVSALGDNKIYKLSFGESFLNDPVVTEVGSTIAIDQPFGNILVNEGGEFYGFVQSRSGNLIRLIYGASMINNPVSEDLGNFDSLGFQTSFTLVKDQSILYLTTIDSNLGILSNLLFPDDCPLTEPIQFGNIPMNQVYSASGQFVISLNAVDDGGNIDYSSLSITVSEDTAPDIDILSDDNICSDVSNSFSAVNISANITSFAWDFHSDQIIDDTIANPTFQFDSAADYTVRLDVEAVNGCHNFAEQDITIYPPPPVPAFALQEAVLCTENELHILNTTVETGYDDVLTYTWDIVELDSTFTGDEPTLSFSTGGEYILQSFSSLPGCDSESVSDTITVNDAPQTDFSASDNCLGETTSFLNQSESVLQYTWDFGDGFESTLESPDHQYASIGDYAVSLITTDNIGCQNTVSKPISITSIPEAGFETSLICAGDEILFQDTSSVVNGDVTAWDWYVNDELVSTERNPTLTFPSAGNVTIRQEVMSSGGCSIGLEKTVSVQAKPDPTLEILTGCVDRSFLFINTTDPSEYVAFEWEIDGVTYGSDSVELLFATPGEYELQLTMTNLNLCTSVLTQNFTVYEPALPDFAFFDTCENEFTLIADSTVATNDPIISREWIVDGEPIGNGTQAIRMFGESGVYEVTLNVTTESLCQYSVMKSVNILPSPLAGFDVPNDHAVSGTDLTFSSAANSDSVFWFVSDSLTKEGGDLNFTFHGDGLINVSQVAINDIGCSDTVSANILVAVPEMDLSIIEFDLDESDGFGSVILNVENKSNLPVEEVEIIIDLQNQFQLRETLETRIDIGERNILRPSIEVPLSLGSLSNVCVTVKTVLSEDDQNPFDNEACISLARKTIIEPPFPNPASNELNIKAILSASQKAEISVISLAGQVEINQRFENLEQGLNNFLISLDSIEGGVYFLKVTVGNKTKTSRIVIRK